MSISGYGNLGIILEFCLLQETRQHCLQPGDSFQSKSNVGVSLLQRPTCITGELLRNSWSHRRLEQSSKDNNKTLAWRQYFERMDCHFSGCRIYFEKLSHSSVSPNGSENQVVEVGVAPFAITPNDAQGYFVLPIRAIPGSAQLTFFPQM